jgi:molecular chaperone HscB
VSELRALLDELRDDERTRFDRLSSLLDNGADQPAAEAVRQLMFLERLAGEISHQIERLEH